MRAVLLLEVAEVVPHPPALGHESVPEMPVAGEEAFPLARAHGVNATLRFVTPEETGAEHCQHDNPTIGQELMADWLADVFGIDQRRLASLALAPLG